MLDFDSLKDIVEEQQLREKLKAEIDYKMALDFISKSKRVLPLYKEIRKDLGEILHQNEQERDEDEIDVLAYQMTLEGVATKLGYNSTMKSLSSFDSQLLPHEQQFLKIALDMSEKKVKSLKGFFYGFDLFPALLFKEGKGADECLERFSQALKAHPVNSFELALACLTEIDSFPKEIHQKLDRWLAGQLSSFNFKKYKNDADFIEPLKEYLNYCSTDANQVNQLICRRMDAFDEKLQNRLWNRMFKLNFDDKKSLLMVQTFLSSDHNDLTNQTFYRQFLDYPESFRSKILGQLSENEQKRYFNIAKKQQESLDKIKIKDPQTEQEDFLLWHLYNCGKIQDKEILNVIQNQNLKERFLPARQSFLFCDKKAIKGEVFLAGCQKVKDSTFASLMWLNSFKNIVNFDSYLASSWSSLPVQIRQNKNIQTAMDNRFDLMYRLACGGDTSALNEIKQSMKDDYDDFIKRLMRPHKDGDTSLHQLCRQGKKGVLKLLEYLPKEKQNALLNQKNDFGKTPLDLASEDFRRYLDQKSFVRPKEEEQLTEEIVPEVKKEETVQVLPQKEEKPLRPFVSATRYKADKKKFENNPNVLKGMEDKLKELRSLSDVELNLRSKKESKIAFKSKMSATGFSANGNVYRLGYIVQDGVIGVLFVMTHQQYDNELKTNGQLDKNAQNFRQQIHLWRIGRGGNPGH